MTAEAQYFRDNLDVVAGAPVTGDVWAWDGAQGKLVITNMGTQIELDAAVAAAPVLAPATSARNVIQPTAGVTPLTLKNFDATNRNLQEWKRADDSLAVRVDNYGFRAATSGSYMLADTANPAHQLIPTQAGNLGLVIKGFAAQTADLTQWQNSAAAVLLSVSSAGVIRGSASSVRFDASGFKVLDAGSTTWFRVTTANAWSDSVASYFFQIGPSAGKVGVIQAEGGNKLDRLMVNSKATVISGEAYGAVPHVAGQVLTIRALAATDKLLVVCGMAAQSGNVFETQDSAAAVGMAIDSSLSLKWFSANEQATVGAAGAASALPANPTKYLKVKDSSGATLVVPAYAAA